MKEVLIVDDEKDIIEELEIFLNRRGYKVYSALSATDAWNQFKSRRPPVVITDYRMPFISGLELLQKVKSLDSLCQVIFISGKADIRTAVQAMKDDAFDFLMKPIHLDELWTALEKAWRRHRSLKVHQAPLDGDQEMIHDISGINRNVSLIKINRELDDTNVHALRRQFRDLRHQGVFYSDVVFDLDRVSYINNVGLNLMIDMQKSLQSMHEVWWCGLHENVSSYLRTLGYHTYFRLAVDLESALREIETGG